ncbi:MAG: T9SS type A sorting domain-containing protein, partial [Myxococcales bacterium]|nr:T9SS type A sorting domain-containing protein [Myxococcales bacterium]
MLHVPRAAAGSGGARPGCGNTGRVRYDERVPGPRDRAGIDEACSGAALLLPLLACAPVPGAPPPTRDFEPAPAPAVMEPRPRPPPSIHAGTCHGCTVDGEGRLACWGCNDRGQLGDGTREDRATPVAVQGLGPVARVALGTRSTCAIDDDEQVWCWGANDHGQCGSAGEDVLQPTRVPAIARAARISVGGTSACALTHEHQIACWGEDRYLPGASLGARFGPVHVDVSLDGEAVDVRLDSAGNTCVLDSSEAVTCWGSTLGAWTPAEPAADATPEDRQRWFAALGGPFVIAREVTGFVEHGLPICAWTRSMATPSWACLDPKVQARLAMPDAPGEPRAPGPWLSVSWSHACSVDAGRVRCWGSDAAHQLGTSVTASLDDAVQVATGPAHTCALRRTGAVTCWGNDRRFATGDASMAVVGPVAPAPEGSARQELSLRGIHELFANDTERPCAIGQDRTVRCLVDGSWRRVVGLRSVVELSTGDSHACARSGDGSVRCWGQWYFGPYNHDGDESDFLRARRPRRIEGLQARAIESWGETDCALTMDGSVSCWGRHAGESLVPQVLAGPSDAVDLAMSERWGCGIEADGKARCWAAADDMSGEPELRLDDVATISLAGDRGCALHRSSTVSCWGDGPVGDGTWSDRAAPVAVAALDDAVAISVGVTHACALTRTGAIRCWGGNDQGQLGDGTYEDRPLPGPVPCDLITATGEAHLPNESIVLVPNPATTVLSYLHRFPVVRARVWDASGRVVMDERPTGNAMDVRALAAGHYVLELTTTDGLRSMSRWVKE